MPLAGAILLAVAGYYPTRRLRGDEGIRAMVVAQGMVLAVVYATLLPAMKWMAAVEPAKRLETGLKVGTIRLVVTILLIGAGTWMRWAETRAFLMWAAIAYIVMIKIETVVLLMWSRRIEKRT
jgi:hypothetical protein